MAMIAATMSAVLDTARSMKGSVGDVARTLTLYMNNLGIHDNEVGHDDDYCLVCDPEHEAWPHILRHRSEEQSAKKEEMVQQRVFGRNLELTKPRMIEAGSAKQQIRRSKTMHATLKAALSKATVARWIWARVGSIVGWVQ